MLSGFGRQWERCQRGESKPTVRPSGQSVATGSPPSRPVGPWGDERHKALPAFDGSPRGPTGPRWEAVGTAGGVAIAWPNSDGANGYEMFVMG